MKKEDIKVCILRTGGTNCDKEIKTVFDYIRIDARVVHSNQFIKGRENLSEYDILVFPGGFSYGDYVRAGAIWANNLKAKIGNQIREFYDEGKPIIGICNGFQVLVELGVLPAFNGLSEYPEVALATNDSSRYECRLVYLRNENRGNAIHVKNLKVKQTIPIPIGHKEGKFLLPSKKKEEFLGKLEDNDQIVFRYCKPDGSLADGEFPYNPNGSLSDIAGICNPEGNVLGMMPHPERYSFGWQYRSWTRDGLKEYGEGLKIFTSTVEYVSKKF
jgi:phosphoribosylformylglycinamidine synthase